MDSGDSTTVDELILKVNELRARMFRQANTTEAYLKTIRKSSHWKSPNLYKTQMCDHWRRGGKCKYGPKCWYAHSLAELRKSSQQAVSSGGSSNGGGSSGGGDNAHAFAFTQLQSYESAFEMGADASAAAPSPSPEEHPQPPPCPIHFHQPQMLSYSPYSAQPMFIEQQSNHYEGMQKVESAFAKSYRLFGENPFVPHDNRAAV